MKTDILNRQWHSQKSMQLRRERSQVQAWATPSSLVKTYKLEAGVNGSEKLKAVITAACASVKKYGQKITKNHKTSKIEILKNSLKSNLCKDAKYSRSKRAQMKPRSSKRKKNTKYLRKKITLREIETQVFGIALKRLSGVPVLT